MNTKKVNSKTLRRRRRVENRNDEDKPKAVSILLSPEEKVKLDSLQQKFGTLNRSHSVSELIEQFSFRQEKSDYFEISTTEIVSLAGFEINPEESVKAYRELFEEGVLDEIRISKRGSDMLSRAIGLSTPMIKEKDNINRCIAIINSLQQSFYSSIALHIRMYEICSALYRIAVTDQEKSAYAYAINSLIDFEYIAMGNIVKASPNHRLSIYFISKDANLAKMIKIKVWNDHQRKIIGLMNRVHPIHVD